MAEPRVRTILFSPVAMILLMSSLAHKEWRFVIYTVPIFNIAAARGARWLYVREFMFYSLNNVPFYFVRTRQRTRGTFGRLCVVIVAGLLTGNLLVTYVLSGISRTNYPGGEALMRLNQIFANVSAGEQFVDSGWSLTYCFRHLVHVHIDNYAAQTGASLFLQEHAPPYPLYITSPAQADWIYNKTENLPPSDITRSKHFTHVITENLQDFPKANWIVVESIKAFSGVKWHSQFKIEGIVRFPLEFMYSESLWILERRI